MNVRDAAPKDIPAILAIYNRAIRETTAAWTNREETLDDRLTWFEGRKKEGLPVLVAENDKGEVLAFASFGPFRPREGYRFTAEHTVYVDPKAQRQGVAFALLSQLIDIAGAKGLHLLLGVIDGENAASIALHEKLGFEVTGRLPQAGTKFGRWLDLVLMTLVLNAGMPAPKK
ncbi:GNAT family N-acetyltransferase [Roseibium marinum]|uniref:Phosphinothricin acetyltransferase n=1 Tax=Roseibium marinum TaxID=281252 RepID=A0A2S3V393_9HYPH|nr:GNAT family N-acetyltransferase [Roseibium marinum]POF34385.1 phosphinothricin acetyltransferase [Roseibium marinum]